jgi:L-serine dehydratase
MVQYIFKEFVDKAKKEKKTIGTVIYENEKKEFRRSENEIQKKLSNSFSTFHKAIDHGLKQKYKFKGLMYSADAEKLKRTKITLLGRTLHNACIYSLAIIENNLCMGTVIACPTAGSSGIVPACILAVAEQYHIPQQEQYRALLTAAAIELSIIKNASISGAAHGCQAECGSAAAMAAGAIVQMLNQNPRTNPEMVDHAAALALKNMLGLACDPVAGIVSVPCRKRNATTVGVAFIAAQMALAGIESFIPFDEVTKAMDSIGDHMDDEFKETARGGLAKTPTGKRWDELKDKLLKEAHERKVSFADILYKHRKK